MTKLEMKENLKAKCEESWEKYKLMERSFGKDEDITQRALGAWVALDDLYLELFREDE